MAFQITSLTIVYSAVYSGTDQSKHQSSAPLAFVRGIRRWPVNSRTKSVYNSKEPESTKYIHLSVRNNNCSFLFTVLEISMNLASLRYHGFLFNQEPL